MGDSKERFCIIHKEGSQYEPDDPLISPLSYESWVTLIEAAKVGKHDGILKIARNVKEGEVPVLFYHRKCRSVFTLKRDLQSLKRKVGFEEEEDEDEVVTLETPRKRSKATSSRVSAQESIFL